MKNNIITNELFYRFEDVLLDAIQCSENYVDCEVYCVVHKDGSYLKFDSICKNADLAFSSVRNLVIANKDVTYHVICLALSVSHFARVCVVNPN